MLRRFSKNESRFESVDSQEALTKKMSYEERPESYYYFYYFPSSPSYSVIYDRTQKTGGKEEIYISQGLDKKIETTQAGRHLIEGIMCLQKI